MKAGSRLLTSLRNALTVCGIYQRLEFSELHELWLTVAHPETCARRRSLAAFHRRLLPDAGLVFDVGANVGEMTWSFLEIGCRVVAIEPDVHSARILKRRFRNRAGFQIVQAAASDSRGTARLYVHAPHSAYNTINSKHREALERPGNPHIAGVQFARELVVQTTTLDVLIAEHGQPTYIKIDAEGHDAAVVRGLSRHVPLVSFEATLPEFHDETLETLHRLASLDANAQFAILTSGTGLIDVWTSIEAVRREVDRVGFLEIYCRMPGAQLGSS